MRRTILLLFGVVTLLYAGNPLTLDAIFKDHAFKPHSPAQLAWVPGQKALTWLEKADDGTGLIRYDVLADNEEVLVAADAFRHPLTANELTVASYKWVDPQTLLIAADEKSIWRHSVKARYFLIDIKTQEIRSLLPGDPYLQYVKSAPDGKKIGFVKENDLYVLNLPDNKLKRLTSDGSATILNGRFDWVYEEEFSISDGWSWSPDGSKIAFWRFDQSMVPTYSWLDYRPLSGEVVTIHYPKAGQSNARVSIHVADLETGEIVDAGQSVFNESYLPRMEWLNNERLIVQNLNRAQNSLALLNVDFRNGRADTILVEHNEAWVNVDDDLKMLEDGRFLWTSERDGFNHIYLGDANGTSLKQITSGKWEVVSVYGSDGEYVYFKANREAVSDYHIYKVKTDGSDPTRLVSEPGRHEAVFSADFALFVDRWSSVSRLRQWDIVDNGGKPLRTLVENSAPADRYNLVVPQFGSFNTSDGVSLNTLSYFPPDFDAEKKYPVLMYGYGGPGSQTVRNTFGPRYYHQQRHVWFMYLAQQGYIVFILDNRGSGGRGKAFKNYSYGDLSKYAVEDHLAGARYLAGLPYVDKERIGIWGWSFGGYLTLHALSRDSGLFRMGISVAPVSDFRWYDTIYTERFMRTPQQNPQGYDAASAFSYLDGYDGSLLLIHGTADDNVHVQHAMNYMEALQQRAAPFDVMLYPGLNHRLDEGNSFLHLHKMMTDYIMENL